MLKLRLDQRRTRVVRAKMISSTAYHTYDFKKGLRGRGGKNEMLDLVSEYDISSSGCT